MQAPVFKQHDHCTSRLEWTLQVWNILAVLTDPEEGSSLNLSTWSYIWSWPPVLLLAELSYLFFPTNFSLLSVQSQAYKTCSEKTCWIELVWFLLHASCSVTFISRDLGKKKGKVRKRYTTEADEKGDVLSFLQGTATQTQLGTWCDPKPQG